MTHKLITSDSPCFETSFIYSKRFGNFFCLQLHCLVCDRQLFCMYFSIITPFHLFVGIFLSWVPSSTWLLFCNMELWSFLHQVTIAQGLCANCPSSTLWGCAKWVRIPAQLPRNSVSARAYKQGPPFFLKIEIPCLKMLVVILWLAHAALTASSDTRRIRPSRQSKSNTCWCCCCATWCLCCAKLEIDSSLTLVMLQLKFQNCSTKGWGISGNQEEATDFLEKVEM